ncbi:hypothetical protein PLICRDRAFT_115752 [Plicaturopsis crispa FD-325 SS-3]|nr:hypothetical protein PLICRDRAFT_115752 [Plicaturopsis crispa FD-325 SS-3]
MSFTDLFRLLDDPFFRTTPTFYAPARSLRDAPFFQNVTSGGGNDNSGVELTEEGDRYIVEAEVPGVKKENLDITVGDGARSVTIQGKVFRRNRGAAPQKAIEAEQQQPEQSTYSSSFTRTVWLPRPVAADKVQASLVDGILTVTIPKVAEAQNVRVAIQ